MSGLGKPEVKDMATYKDLSSWGAVSQSASLAFLGDLTTGTFIWPAWRGSSIWRNYRIACHNILVSQSWGQGGTFRRPYSLLDHASSLSTTGPCILCSRRLLLIHYSWFFSIGNKCGLWGLLDHNLRFPCFLFLSTRASILVFNRNWYM